MGVGRWCTGSRKGGIESFGGNAGPLRACAGPAQPRCSGSSSAQPEQSRTKSENSPERTQIRISRGSTGTTRCGLCHSEPSLSLDKAPAAAKVGELELGIVAWSHETLGCVSTLCWQVKPKRRRGSGKARLGSSCWGLVVGRAVSIDAL